MDSVEDEDNDGNGCLYEDNDEAEGRGAYLSKSSSIDGLFFILLCPWSLSILRKDENLIRGCPVFSAGFAMITSFYQDKNDIE